MPSGALPLLKVDAGRADIVDWMPSGALRLPTCCPSGHKSW